MPTDQNELAIAQEYERSGIQRGERLPMPKHVDGPAAYLAFLRSVPAGSGIDGFTRTMKERGNPRTAK